MRPPRPTLAIALAALATAVTPGVAAADDIDLSSYDTLPPNRAWPGAIGLEAAQFNGERGNGVTVAVLDTGGTPGAPLNLRARADSMPEGDGVDRYGHGTHMAGIVAGSSTGVAPGANVVHVKVAGWNGSTDVTSVLAGLEWIAAHRAQYGIRVVNLSYGTDSSQKVEEDALNFAVQRLWAAGVVVVSSAGNGGQGQRVDKPGDDPHVITVGAADDRGTATTADDAVAPFSSGGQTQEGVSKPDLLAPGISILSHRAPGSTIDGLRPATQEGDLTKGTGTSQAAAVVSGVAALMIKAKPSITPNELKAALTGTTSPGLRGRDGAGAGLVNAAAAVQAARTSQFASSPANGGLSRSSGTGSIDGTRGSYKPYTDYKERGKPEQLSGDTDALGNPWDAGAWAGRAWTSGTWTSSPFARVTSVSDSWAPSPWQPGWGGFGWSEETWRARMWTEFGSPDVFRARMWTTSGWN